VPDWVGTVAGHLETGPLIISFQRRSQVVVHSQRTPRAAYREEDFFDASSLTAGS